MTSPNEPGQPGSGERPASGDGRTRVPPRQGGGNNPPDGASARGAADAAAREGDHRASRYVTGVAAPDLSAMSPLAQRSEPQLAPTRSEPQPARPEPQLARPEPQLARSEFQPARLEFRNERTEITPVTEAYPSELPDLSGLVPKPALPREAPADPMRARTPFPRLSVGARSRGPVRATMQIRRIDPWSALKVSLLLNAALFFVWMIAVAFLYLVLGAMGVWSKLNNNVGDLLTSGNGGGGDLVSAGSIFGSAALIGLVNIVLLTAMATAGAYIYNLSTDIVGGVEVTLADLD
ncbi:MAG: DUF3566 domain-containing protein [Mycobacterium sp.]